ncbi:MAG: HEAT repeat domain-containing protein [Planctomycetota bacterium]
MSLKDVEEHTFREVEGRLLCPECQLKQARPKRMRCPHCGEQVMAVLHGGKYTCARCGREIGGEQSAGVIPSAQPVGRREPDHEPEAEPVPSAPSRPRTSVRSRRKRSRTSPALVVLLSCFVAATLVLAALLVRQHARTPGEDETEAAADDTRAAAEKKEPPLREEEEPVARRRTTASAADEKVATVIRDWIKSRPGRPLDKIEIYRDLARQIEDPVLRARTLEVLTDFELAARSRVKTGEQEIADLTRRLEEAQQRIEQLQKQLEARAAGPEQPAGETEPETEPTPKTRAEQAAAAYRAALAEARALLETKKYGPAMAALQAVADKFDGTEAAEKAAEERARIRRDASRAFHRILADARELKRAEDYKGARQRLAEATRFEVDAFRGQLEQTLAELRRLEQGGDPEAAAGPPAQVRELIDRLKDQDEFDRSNAADRLGALGDRSAVPALLDALKDKSWTVRAAAAASLGKLGDRRAVPHLIARLDDDQKTVVHDALVALTKLTGQHFSAAEKDRWLAWFEANREEAGGGPAASAQQGTTFRSRVRVRKPAERIIGIEVPATVDVPVGSRLEIRKDGERIAEIVVETKKQNLVYGKVGEDVELEIGADLAVRLIE